MLEEEKRFVESFIAKETTKLLNEKDYGSDRLSYWTGRYDANCISFAILKEAECQIERLCSPKPIIASRVYRWMRSFGNAKE